MITKIVVISLPEAAGRRAAFAARAHGAAVDWNWFDAVSGLGPGLVYDLEEAILAKGRPLHPGELGCYSSHYAAWTMLLQSDARQLVVLEDDTIVDWAFLEKVARLDLQASGVLYLRLFAKRPCAFRRVQVHAIEHRRFLIEFLGYAYGTQAYVITREGAERFVRHCRRVRRPIDDELDRSWAHGVPSLCVFPFPVIEQSTASNIGLARFERFRIPPRLVLGRLKVKATERMLRLRRRLRLLGRARTRALKLPDAQ